MTEHHSFNTVFNTDDVNMQVIYLMKTLLNAWINVLLLFEKR